MGKTSKNDNNCSKCGKKACRCSQDRTYGHDGDDADKYIVYYDFPVPDSNGKNPPGKK